MKFTDYLNARLDEKLGNLNASNDPKYAFLLKAALKNKNLRGLAGPNSKIVTLAGKGSSQFVKDLRDVQKKMGDPQLVFLTTEYKVTMIKNDDEGKWDDSSNSWVSTPIGMNSNTVDIFIGNIETWDSRSGPTLPKVDIEGSVMSAKGNRITRRLKNSLDTASLGNDTEYHAVVILPDPENLSKDQQRAPVLYKRMHNSGDKAESIRQEREKAQISYHLFRMTFDEVRDIIFDGNATVTLDGVTYKKDPAANKQQCEFTKNGDYLKLIDLYSVDDNKPKALVYNFHGFNNFTVKSR